MSACEKCWSDAYHRSISSPMKSQAEYYSELLEERKENPCSEKDQQGQFYKEKKLPSPEVNEK